MLHKYPDGCAALLHPNPPGKTLNSTAAGGVPLWPPHTHPTEWIGYPGTVTVVTMQPVSLASSAYGGRSLRELLTSATKELFVMLPTPASPICSLLENLFLMSAIGSGVRVRLLARAVGEPNERILPSQIDVRVASSQPWDGGSAEFVVVDRRTACVRPHCGAMPIEVAESALVPLVCAYFEDMWRQAAVTDTNPRSGDEQEIAGILRRLADGLTDQVAARDMNMSVRTYRRRVATIMQTIGASSRFQAGILAARLRLLP
jgi:hypothetical protein